MGVIVPDGVGDAEAGVLRQIEDHRAALGIVALLKHLDVQFQEIDVPGFRLNLLAQKVQIALAVDLGGLAAQEGGIRKVRIVGRFESNQAARSLGKMPVGTGCEHDLHRIAGAGLEGVGRLAHAAAARTAQPAGGNQFVALPLHVGDLGRERVAGIAAAGQGPLHVQRIEILDGKTAALRREAHVHLYAPPALGNDEGHGVGHIQAHEDAVAPLGALDLVAGGGIGDNLHQLAALGLGGAVAHGAAEAAGDIALGVIDPEIGHQGHGVVRLRLIRRSGHGLGLLRFIAGTDALGGLRFLRRREIVDRFRGGLPRFIAGADALGGPRFLIRHGLVDRFCGRLLRFIVGADALGGLRFLRRRGVFGRLLRREQRDHEGVADQLLLAVESAEAEDRLLLGGGQTQAGVGRVQLPLRDQHGLRQAVFIGLFLLPQQLQPVGPQVQLPGDKIVFPRGNAAALGLQQELRGELLRLLRQGGGGKQGDTEDEDKNLCQESLCRVFHIEPSMKKVAKLENGIKCFHFVILYKEPDFVKERSGTRPQGRDGA